MTDATESLSKTKRPRRMAREPKQAEASAATASTSASAASQPPPKRAGKTGLVLDMLRRPEGTTIAQLIAATGWLPHTTRAALTGLKKKGHQLTSAKAAGEERVYRVVSG